MPTPNEPERPANHPAATPSGPRDESPATSSHGDIAVTSATPENKLGHINPSAPNDGNITPGSMPEK